MEKGGIPGDDRKQRLRFKVKQKNIKILTLTSTLTYFFSPYYLIFLREGL